MRHTIEVRSPFFDTELAKYAIQIPGKFKVLRQEKVATKRILREIARDYLPKYITDRQKAAFANGAGMKVGTNFLTGDGIMGLVAEKAINASQFKKTINEYLEYNFITKEEVYFFQFYKEFGYTKFKEGKKRIIVKDNLKSINKERDEVAEATISRVLRHRSTDRRETFKFNNSSTLRNAMMQSLKNEDVLQLVTYWGVEKATTNNQEVYALDSLQELQQNLNNLKIKLQVILILTDIHGELNKTPKEVINSYYHAIERLAMNYRFTIVYLSDLWKKYNISLKDLTLSLSNEKNSPEQFLISAAKKHYHGKDFLTGAKLYKLCSSYDSKIICKEFPYSFFATYNGALWKPILPSLPTISFWSERRGFHSKPWHSSPIPV